ncbi:peptide transporter family 1-like isoform X2 [Diabrotica virgifera virgifera]|uniref:Peptide transporter family 1-like n=1 Tax=Diabrotica virgifera virgifera TaxID=50390 RepID=A0ABM5KW68_DIAVI|nr:peptide transporter family 1-like isoform X2 [Diabrotica virgifera virgifera]
MNKKEEMEKIPYPKSVFFIVSNEFCERFSYYGMRTILILYLTNILLFSESQSLVTYHSFSMAVYFFPIIGAIISDSFLGKFNTILYVSMIYASGSILLALTASDPIGLPKVGFSVLGLLLIAVGTGGIKPCVAAFGGDQFRLPQQEKDLERFFSLFYFSINAGSLISTFITPILRNDVHCFGNESCFPLAFAVPGILMIISVVIFGLGRPTYKIKKPEGNVIVQVTKCIVCGIKNKFKSKDKKEHWLDYAEEKYGEKLVNEVKATLHVLVLFLPLPIFWALYDQQGSGWTLMAVRMDGNIGFYTILPDQMQVVNPLLILAFIPLFTYYVYPLLGKCNLLKTSLQRMACGGLLAAVAFAVSAFVTMAIEKNDPVLPSAGNLQLRVYNPSNCQMSLSTDVTEIKSFSLDPISSYVMTDIDWSGNKSVTFTFESNSKECPGGQETFDLLEKNAYGVFIQSNGTIRFYKDDVAKSKTGYPLVRTLPYTDTDVKYTLKGKSININSGNTSAKEFSSPGHWSINVGKKQFNKTVNLELGGTYAVMLNKNQMEMAYTIVTKPNSVHIAWLLPQYFIITAAEIMFSITGLEFSYSQAPASMKSLLQACFLLTTAFGNLIIVIIESMEIFEKKSNDFFLYCGLMVADMLIFSFMAMRYKYIKKEESPPISEIEPIATKENQNGGIDNPSFVKSSNNVNA